ncbi:MAG: tyrosine-type recombinase/integrase [Dehalococcoidales bacterium]|nr:tyrosine-type recombinase/integrase [Dehalococcoidales bacterium]
MNYRVHREVKEGMLIRLSLGIPEVDAYLAFLRHRCRPNTWINYAHDLQVFVNAVRKPLTLVMPRDIFAFIQQQREAPVCRGHNEGLVTLSPSLSPRTIKRRLTTISGFYNYLIVLGDTHLRANPVPHGLLTRGRFLGGPMRGGNGRGVTPLVRVPQTLPQILEAETVRRFLNSLRTHRDEAMVLLMLLGGLRKSEVLGLSLEDLNFGQRTVLVKEGKGGHQRVVPVAPSALETILRYLNEERPAGSSTRVFLALKGPRRGQPLSVAALDTIIDYHRRQAGTPEVRCHRLRHTCLTRLRQAGMSLESLQAQAGHRSIMSTRIYLHLCPKELQEEYLRLSDSLFVPKGEKGSGL